MPARTLETIELARRDLAEAGNVLEIRRPADHVDRAGQRVAPE